MSARITPTAHAEELYQAKLNAKFDKAMKKGPAGVMIPPANQIYRKSIDGQLLIQIGKVAYADYRKRILSPERRERVVASLRADLLRRFPDEDMRVLQKYERAGPTGTAIVEMIAGDFERPEHMQLPEPVLLPGAALFHADLGGRGSSGAAPVPADTIGYFRDLLSVRREWSRSFEPSYHWTGIFRTEEGRWPRWAEIERQFPLIGEWMEGQRI